MLIPLEVVPVPEILVPEIGTSVEAMRDSDLPAFVVRNASTDGFAAFEEITPTLTELGYTRSDMSKKRPFGFHRKTPLKNNRSTDRVFHVDRYVSEGNAPVISTHFTSAGVVAAAFIEVRDPSIHGHGAKNIPEKYIEQIKARKVDAGVLESVIYTAILGPCDMVGFRLAGAVPLAHSFITLEWPRFSAATDWHQHPEITDTSYIDTYLDSVS